MASTRHSIRSDAIDDFHRIVNAHGFKESDFELESKELPPGDLSGELYPIELKIKVVRISNNKERVYDGGHITKWAIDFEENLTAGFFGKP